MTTVILQPNAANGIDAFIADQSLANTNFGTNTQLIAGRQLISSLNTNIRSLIRFDLSAYIGSVIEAGTELFLDGTGSSFTGGGSITFSIHRVTQTGWTEGGVTWNKYDGTNAWASAGGDFVASPWNSQGPYSSTVDLTFDMQAAVQDAIDNRSGILDILLNSDAVTTNNYLTIHSSDALLETSGPKLTIIYSMAPQSASSELSLQQSFTENCSCQHEGSQSVDFQQTAVEITNRPRSGSDILSFQQTAIETTNRPRSGSGILSFQQTAIETVEAEQTGGRPILVIPRRRLKVKNPLDFGVRWG
jgi:hypothetical protein